MARGMVSGALWGGVVSVLGVGILSVAGEGPYLRQPAPVQDAPQTQAAVPADNAAGAPEVAADMAPKSNTVVDDLQASAPDTLAALADEARQPATAPETLVPEGTPTAPAIGSTAPGVTAENQVARAPAPSSAPEAPLVDRTAKVPLRPAEPTEIASNAPGLETPSINDTTVGQIAADPAPLPGAAPQGADVVTAPEAPRVATAPAPVEAETGVASPAAPAAGQIALNEAALEDAPLPVPQPALPASDALDVLPATEGPADPPAPRVASLPRITEGETNAPRVGQPARPLVSAAANSRLPKVETADTSATERVTPASDLPPLKRFAAPIEMASDRPLMSIVLVDDGTGPIGAEVLDGFPYPVTIAVDPASDVALQRAAEYRALGLEVMALSDVPAGARAQDVEVTLAANLAAVPEAVGILERSDGGLQASRAVSDQVTAILSETGHGLVLFPKGLNTAVSLASKAGVPATTVFRDFDGQGQTPKVMRRFLDQAAFKARQENGVVMVGRLQPDTVSALLLWGLQDRAAQVGLVPVSMILEKSAP